MNVLDKIERKLGRRFGIPNLMLYITAGNLLVFLLDYVFALKGASLSAYLYFSPQLILSGQVWRILTFVFVPPAASPLFIIFVLYFYYMIGANLESAWSTSRFTLYYLIGMVGTIIGALFTGAGTAVYLNLSLFFAYAMLYPNHEVRLFFIIPLKMKYLAYLDAAFFLFTIIFSSMPNRVAALVSLLNFFLFFGPGFIQKIKAQMQYRKVRQNFRSQMNNRRW